MLAVALLGLVSAAVLSAVPVVADGGRVVQSQPDGVVLVRDSGDVGHAADGRSVPCALRVDCAGGWVVAGIGLVLALPVAARVVRRRTLVTAVARPEDPAHGVVLAGRLFRPPRIS